MKKRTKIILGSLFIILFILRLNVPSESDYSKWLEIEHNIKKSDKLFYYTQDNIEIFDRSSNRKRFGIFKTREQNFEYTNSKRFLNDGLSVEALEELDSDAGFTIRTLEIGNMIFPMEKESILWKILM